MTEEGDRRCGHETTALTSHLPWLQLAIGNRTKQTSPSTRPYRFGNATGSSSTRNSTASWSPAAGADAMTQ